MCTLSWAPEAAQYTILFNRDELRTRARAALPSRHQIGTMPYLAPIDADQGGTWIGVNQKGIALALLNRYEDTPHEPPAQSVSRGLLVRELLAHPTLEAVAASLTDDRLRPYLPFTLGGFAVDRPAILVQWNGEELRIQKHKGAGLVQTSSGVDQGGVDRIRSRLFAAIPPAPDRLEKLHRSHQPSRGPHSPCMHREDALTVSFTRITVAGTVIRLTYADGPPCRTPPSHHCELAPR